MGKLVFLLASHAEEHIFPVGENIVLLDDWKCSATELVLSCPQIIPVLETVVCWFQDAAPVVGDRLAVVGAGLYGAAATLIGGRLFPLSSWLIVEALATRREQLEAALLETGGPSSRWHVVSPEQALSYVCSEPRFDIVLEVSGSVSGLDIALQLVRPSGRVVIGSWYGRKALDGPVAALGSTRIHRSHAQLVFSQVSEIPPWLAGRYDKHRRMDIVREILTDLSGTLAPLCRNVRSFPFEEAALVYAQLDRGALQAPVRFIYPQLEQLDRNPDLHGRES
jgi:threonine dehydrogenase-like Zn-dependent dehydrogenase